MSGKPDYLTLTYSQERAPKTEYPAQLARYLVDRFRLAPGAKMLEIGCGRGDFLKAFQGTSLDCSGVDREESAKAMSPQADIRACDVATAPLPFADATFDVVYHKSVIEHLYSPDHLMKETHRVLKPGGRCLILTPDWVSQMPVFYEDITHCRPYDVSALRDAFHLFGFTNVGTEKFRQLPATWRSSAARWAARALTAFLSVPAARLLTQKTGIKFFRWSVELMVLGYGEKAR